MPMKAERYPVNWKEISFFIRDACGWQCLKCGKQCRRPTEPFRGHTYTLTVAHLEPPDHAPDAPEVYVAALCAPCHLAQDHERRQRQAAEAQANLQPTLLES